MSELLTNNLASLYDAFPAYDLIMSPQLWVNSNKIANDLILQELSHR